MGGVGGSALPVRRRGEATSLVTKGADWLFRDGVGVAAKDDRI